MKRLVIILAVFLLVCGAVSVVSATQVNFEIGSDNSIVTDPDKLAINADTSLSDNHFFSLDEGASDKFDYADIFQIIVFDSEITSYDITANLYFVLPDELSVGNNGNGKIIEVTGKCGKNADEFWISFDLEEVQFEDEFGNGGLFTVQLSPFTAYLEMGNGKNPSTCPPGADCYSPYIGDKTITATVTLLKAPTPVPEPSTFMMFGTVLIGAIAVKRIKR